MKTQHLIRILFITFFATYLPSTLHAQDTIVHYDNLDDPGNVDGRALKIWADHPADDRAAQRFVAAGDNVTALTLGLSRFGSPGGKEVISIWSVDAGTGDPGERIGVLGEIEINSLPLISSTELPAFLELVTVDGLVTGLTPGQPYFLVLRTVDAILTGGNSSVASALVDSPVNAQPISLFDGASGSWIRPFTGHLHARIEGSLAAHTLAIDTIGNGTVTVSPDMETYPEGTEVTLTAVPDNQVYALVGWDGDVSGQEEIVTITMDADQSVTAEFGSVIAVGPHLYAFGSAKKSLGFPAAEETPFISGDGLSMYYSAMRYDLLPRQVSSIYRVTRPDIDAPWSEPADLMQENVDTGLHYNGIIEPNLTDDGLALYYETLQTANAGAWPTASRWLVVRRTSLEEEFDFSNPELLGPTMWNDHVVPGAVTEKAGPGAITRDGTGFVFASERAGGNSQGAIWYAPWDPVAKDIVNEEATLVAVDPTTRLTSPEMSADGLTVMFWNTGSPHTIYMVARATVEDSWSNPVRLPSPIASANEDDVTMSSDLTRVYFGSHRPGTTPIDPRDPRGSPPGGPGYDIFEAKMRRLLPRIELSMVTNVQGAVKLRWNSYFGQRFIVEASATLDPDSWVEAASGIPSRGAPLEYAVEDPADASTRYYRVRIQ